MKLVKNGNSSSDVSSGADKIASSPAGQSPGSSAEAASLNLKPAISVNAANPADVSFTVSGLASDYSGTVTFTDTTGESDVVPIGSNGNYSANLSNLANGTVTYLMTVTDPAGKVITVDPTATLGDGSANAPAGTPQLPNLLEWLRGSHLLGWLPGSIMQSVLIQHGVERSDDASIQAYAGVSVDNSAQFDCHHHRKQRRA